MNWAATLFASAIEALSRKSGEGRNSLATVTGSMLRYPIKTVAAFAMAPFLAFPVACVAKDPVRRVIAGAGLVVAVVVAWSAAVGGVFALFSVFSIWQLLGAWPAVAWLVFGWISTTVSVISAALALNATAWLFLHMSSEEVVQYLRWLSE